MITTNLVGTMIWSHVSWWRHQMETTSVLLASCAGNSPVPGEFPTKRPVTRSFDVYFDLRPNKRLSKQSWGWWFETLSRPLWRPCNSQAITHAYDQPGWYNYMISYMQTRCPHCRPFARQSTDYPGKGPEMRSFHVFLEVSLNKLLN